MTAAGARRWAWAATAAAVVGALGSAGWAYRRWARRAPASTPCELLVEACTAVKRANGPLQASLFCAETLADLANVDPNSIPEVCGLLHGVLERAPQVGWHRALQEAGFTRKASP